MSLLGHESSCTRAIQPRTVCIVRIGAKTIMLGFLAMRWPMPGETVDAVSRDGPTVHPNLAKMASVLFAQPACRNGMWVDVWNRVERNNAGAP